MLSALLLGFACLALSSVVPCDGGDGREIKDDDFVYVKGLRLYDSKGLHYLTGNPSLCDQRKAITE
jgi:mannan endo-1,4-beta-mannosidase